MTAIHPETLARAPSTSLVESAPSQAEAGAWAPTRKALWAGRIMTGLGAAFLLFDGTFKLLASPEAVEGTTQLGYPASVLLGLGILQLTLLAIYLVPRTAVLGAVLWTGYLGGAVATHVRVENPLFSHVLFPVYIGLLLWGGLWLRDRRLQVLLPLSRS